MNMALQQKIPTRWRRGVLQGMLLLAVLVSLPLGIAVAATGAWFAIQGGSLIYLPLGLVALLVGLVLLNSRSISDFCLFALLAIATIAWSLSGNDAKSRMLSWGVELSGRIDLLLGLLVVMVVALLVAHWHRPFACPVEYSVTKFPARNRCAAGMGYVR